jgi:hypothetical protein
MILWLMSWGTNLSRSHQHHHPDQLVLQVVIIIVQSSARHLARGVDPQEITVWAEMTAWAEVVEALKEMSRQHLHLRAVA